jgi:hypothetical protein
VGEKMKYLIDNADEFKEDFILELKSILYDKNDIKYAEGLTIISVVGDTIDNFVKRKKISFEENKENKK